MAFLNSLSHSLNFTSQRLTFYPVVFVSSLPSALFIQGIFFIVCVRKLRESPYLLALEKEKERNTATSQRDEGE
jgi:energy-coupling factor transporter transmembrane protein EcfT